uniref:hypothetical protein n=1 Tax=Roseovarius indicus TaxID=540747 RepID=UPI003B530205
MKLTFAHWFLIIIALGLLILAFFNLAPPGLVSKINCFLDRNSPILIGIGTVALVSGLALWTAHLSNVSAEKRQEADRLLNAELKLSDFRQKWINELRVDFAEVIQLAYSFFDEKSHQNETVRKLKMVEARVRMRLNPKCDAVLERKIERELTKLVKACESVVMQSASQHSEQSPEGNAGESALKHREELAKLGSEFLKQEWEVIKDNLDKLKRGNR